MGSAQSVEVPGLGRLDLGGGPVEALGERVVAGAVQREAGEAVGAAALRTPAARQQRRAEEAMGRRIYAGNGWIRCGSPDLARKELGRAPWRGS